MRIHIYGCRCNERLKAKAEEKHFSKNESVGKSIFVVESWSLAKKNICFMENAFFPSRRDKLLFSRPRGSIFMGPPMEAGGVPSNGQTLHTVYIHSNISPRSHFISCTKHGQHSSFSY
jgi:hypothetical protein